MTATERIFNYMKTNNRLREFQIYIAGACVGLGSQLENRYAGAIWMVTGLAMIAVGLVRPWITKAQFEKLNRAEFNEGYSQGYDDGYNEGYYEGENE